MRLSPAIAIPLLVLALGQAHAQRLPGAATLPQLPPALDGTVQRALDAPALRAPPLALRRLRLDALLRGQRQRVDVDPRGAPVLRGEFLLVGGDDATLAAVEAAGFSAIRRDEGEALGLALHVLRDRRGRSAGQAMRALRRAAPAAEFAFQHLYLQAGAFGAARPGCARREGAAGSGTACGEPPPERRPRGDVPLPVAAGARPSLRVGLVDGAIDAGDPALAGLGLQRHGCAQPARPDPHAVAVAARLAGQAQGTLYAADLWCGDTVGGATLGLVAALAWMARERVPVVNISLVGPDNPVLARAVATMVARGHVLVAAVGNDGPAAPPLYPASYPGVIGVSGVDARLRVLPEAASGPQVDFVASGIVDADRRALRGTSFAAPVVARLAALRVQEPVPGLAEQAQAALAAQARDLGAPGRDPRYGDGLLDP